MFDKYKNTQPIAHKIFSNTMFKKNISHAYLIATNGYEEGLDFAITFAKALLCPKYNDGQPLCDGCFQCKTIDDGNYPEIKIINPDGYWIKKEQMSELQEEFSKKSILGNKKIYIINKAEKLNISSSNTILKFLEEPSDGIIAILVTNNIYQIIDTIVSRCQIVSLNGQANINDKLSTLEKIGKILSDNENDFIEFMENNKNLEKIESLVKFINYYEKNHNKILLYMNEYWTKNFNDKDSVSIGLLLMIYFYKDVLNYKIDFKIEIFNDYIDNIKEIANMNSIEEIVNKIIIINDNREYIENNANLNLLMDRIIIQIEEGVK